MAKRHLIPTYYQVTCGVENIKTICGIPVMNLRYVDFDTITTNKYDCECKNCLRVFNGRVKKTDLRKQKLKKA